MSSKKVADLERLIEVLVRAIRKERQVRDLYQDTATWAPTELTRALFDFLRLQESEHLERLERTLRILRSELETAKQGKPESAEPRDE